MVKRNFIHFYEFRVLKNSGLYKVSEHNGIFLIIEIIHFPLFIVGILKTIVYNNIKYVVYIFM